MSETLRLFIGSSLQGTPVELLEAFAQGLQKRLKNQIIEPAFRTRGIRWLPASNWHLTWAFLGETSTALIPAIQQGLSETLATQSSLMLSWQQLSWWPSQNRPQVLVCQLQATPETQALAQALWQVVCQAQSALHEGKPCPTQAPKSKKLKHHQSFKPHLTIARLKGRGPTHWIPLPELPPLPTGLPDWRINAITLFSSKLDSSGAIHTPLYTVTLKDNPA